MKKSNLITVTQEMITAFTHWLISKPYTDEHGVLYVKPRYCAVCGQKLERFKKLEVMVEYNPYTGQKICDEKKAQACTHCVHAWVYRDWVDPKSWKLADTELWRKLIQDWIDQGKPYPMYKQEQLED